jgi:hypothetical protein
LGITIGKFVLYCSKKADVSTQANQAALEVKTKIDASQRQLQSVE